MKKIRLVTKAFKGLSIALLGLLPNYIFAAGAVNLDDYTATEEYTATELAKEALATPTITGLERSDGNGGTLSSGYTLTPADGTGAGIITKYIISETAGTISYSPVYYSVEIDDKTYDGTNKLYFYWNENGSLSKTTDYDTASATLAFTVTYDTGSVIKGTEDGDGNYSGDFVGNTTDNDGGAIYNSSGSTIGTITGDFIGNSATEYGGAIYNTSAATISSITGDFIGNSADYNGGAISNYSGSTIGTITGDFIGNTTSCDGGAIFNSGAGSISSITGDFIGNYASSLGGAICSSSASIDTITGDFIGNYTSYKGGAIYSSSSTIGTIIGDFIGNYTTTSSSRAYTAGGAIYNENGTISITGNFIGNSAAMGSGSYAKGGAIYTSSSSDTAAITLVADAGNAYYYTGNWAVGTEYSTYDQYGGFLYIEKGIVEFAVAGDSSITIGYADQSGDNDNYDSIASNLSNASSTYINKTGAGLLTVNSSMKYYYGDLNILEGAMYYTNEDSLEYLTSLTISEGAAFGISASNLGVLTSVVITNYGTLNLIGGTLSATINNEYGTIAIAGKVETTTALSGSLGFDLTYGTDVSLSGSGSVSDVESVIIYMGALIEAGEEVDLLGDSLSFDTLNSTSIYYYGNLTLETQITNTSGDSVDTYSLEDGTLVLNNAAYVFTTTLSDLYYAGEVSVKSAYTLAEADDEAFTITKYYYDTISKTYEGVELAVNIDNKDYRTTEGVGTTDTYYWNSDGKIVTGEYATTDGYTEAFTVTYDTGSAIKATKDADGNYSGNFVGNSLNTNGGAIYNNYGTITTITGDFIGNSADKYGGAISNSSTIGTITGDFIGNTATTGGAIFNDNGTIDTITGDFIGNSVTGSTTSNGGAIYNYGSSAKISTIIGDFIGNSASIYGGAIYNNYGTITTITGDFIGNSAFYGGAIYNNYGIIGTITGDFIGNSTSTNGGAIYNSDTISSITSDFIGNSASFNGGAIYNNEGTISSITSDFIDNSASTNGGAIYNNEGTIGTITGDFIGNSASSSTYGGGAIYNYGTIGIITGDFIGNSASDGSGGAIYNYYRTITTITGDFTGNSASDGFGGAIYNYYGTITTITGDFIGNSAYSGGAIYNNYGKINTITGDFIGNLTYSTGGAIYNSGTINTITGDFTGNSASSSSYGGGAIYNYGTIGIITGDFIGNSATSKGGAIYNSGSSSSITLSADTGNAYYYTGNWAGASAEADRTDASGGFLYINSGTVEFDTVGTASITIGYADQTTYDKYDSIASASTSAIINKTGTGTLTVNSSMAYYKGSLNVNGGIMYYTSSLGLGSTSITVGDAAYDSDENEDTVSDGYTAKLVTSASNFSSSAEIFVDSDGTLELTGGTLDVKSLTGTGSLLFNQANTTLTIDSSMASFTGSFAINAGAATLSSYMSTSSRISIAESCSLTISLNSSNISQTILGSLSGAGSVYITLDATSLADVENLTSTSTYIYNSTSESVSVAWDSSLEASDDTVSITIGGTDYIVSLSNGTITFEEAYTYPTTLSELYDDGKGSVSIPSAYLLKDVEDGDTFTITKYYTDDNGDVQSAQTSVNIEDLGTSGGDLKKYFAWTMSGDNLVLGTVSTSSDADFTYTYNDTADRIAEMTGNVENDFIGCPSTSYDGGAIANTGTGEYNITGDFILNKTTSTYGGAIANVGTSSSNLALIGNITGDFIGNYVDDSFAEGGAISNYYGTIANITGSFIGNSSTNYGGAIANTASSTIDNITGDFIGNYATKSGGAIYNNASSTIGNITGDFIGNYATFGGAIYTNNTITSVTGDFTSNHASSYGGAIWVSVFTSLNSPAYIALSAGTGDSYYYTGNWAGDSAEAGRTDASGGFLYMSAGTVEFATTGTGSITVGYTEQSGDYDTYDSIAGTSSSIINKTGAGTLIVNSSMKYYLGALNVKEGTMYYNNDEALNAYEIVIGTSADSNTAKLEFSIDVLGSSKITINSDGTLSLLDDGKLTNANISGAGTLAISGEVESEVEIVTNLDIYEDATLTINATNLAASSISNSGIIYLKGSSTTDGTLVSTLSGIVSIASGNYIYATAENLGYSTLTNAGTLTLSGTSDLSATLTNSGTLNANALYLTSVSNEESSLYGISGGTITTTLDAYVDLVQVNSSAKVESNADYIDIALTNYGSLTLTGGELTYAITNGEDSSTSLVSIAGTTTVSESITADDIDITGTVVITDDKGSLTSTSTIEIVKDAKLTTDASSLEATSVVVESNGSLELTGGALTSTLNNAGTVDTEADFLGSANTIINTGTLSIDGGTLNSSINYTDASNYNKVGNIIITANTSASDNVYIATNTLSIATGIDLSINAGNLYIGALENDGDLEFTGTNVLDNGISIQNNAGATITANASNLGTGCSITNDGIVYLTDGELTRAITEGTDDDSDGLIQIDGKVSATSSLLGNATEITLDNALTLTDVDGTLNIDITGAGSLVIGNASDSASLEIGNGSIDIDGTLSVSSYATLKSNTEDLSALAISLAKDGILNLTGGELEVEVSGLGTIFIDEGDTLSSNATYLGSATTNDGTLTLTGGELNSAISGSGDIKLTSAISVNDTNGSLSASSLKIENGASLTTSATNISSVESLTNEGTLNLTSGELSISTVIGGTVSLSGAAGLNVTITNDNLNSTIINKLIVTEDNSYVSVGLDSTLDFGTLLSTSTTVYKEEDIDSSSYELSFSVFGEDYTNLSEAQTNSYTLEDGITSISYTIDGSTLSFGSISIRNEDDEIDASYEKGDDGNTSLTVESGDLSLSSNQTVDKVDTTADDTSISVGDGATLTTSEIVGEGLVVDGGSLVYDTTEVVDSKDNIAIQNVDNTITSEIANNAGASIATSTSGDITIVSDGNILLLGGDFEVTSGSTLTLTTSKDSAVVSVSESSTYGNTDEDSGTLVVNSTLSLDADVDFTANVDLVLTDSAELADGASLSIRSSLSATDESTTEIIINSSDSGTGSASIAIGEDDDNATSLGVTVSTNLEDVALNGDISSEQTTAIKLTGESTTISGTASVEAGIAIEVANTTGEVTFADGASISSTGTVVTNTHVVGVDNGLTLIANGTLSLEGNITANSPLYIKSGDTAEDGSTVTVAGGVITTNAADEDNSTVTIGTNTNLVLTTDSTGTMTYFYEADDIVLEGTDSNVATISVESQADMLVGDSYLIADKFTVDAQTGDDFDFETDVASIGGDFYVIINEYGEACAVVGTLTNFQDKYNGSSTNELNLAIALDGIVNDGVDTEAKSEFKSSMYDSDLSDYIMDNYSYIAEVNTMLLSNQNYANVNRARSILNKAAAPKLITEVEILEEATGVKIESTEVSEIKYTNVAQLQVISLMGNKNASNGVAGYDYYSVGSTANFDEILSENALIGASIGGTYNKVTGDAGDNANSTTFLLNAYAVYAYEGFELFGNVGYAHFWNEGSKAGSGSADWDSDAFNGLIGVSYKMETTLEGLSISPVAMLNLVCQDADSAAYSNGVTVDDQSYFSAKLMLGFEVECAINAQFNVLARAMYSHEMGDTSYDNTYSLGFVNGVNYIGSSAGKDSALMGLGLSYDFSETCTAYFDYNAYVYESLITHSLNLSVALKF